MAMEFNFYIRATSQELGQDESVIDKKSNSMTGAQSRKTEISNGRRLKF